MFSPSSVTGILVAVAAALSLTCAAPAGPAASGDRLIAVEGSPVVVKVWEEPGVGGEAVPYYAISLDGKGFSDPRPTSYVLKLRHGRFVPLADTPAPFLEPGFEADESINLYIVQFLTQPLEEYRSSIRDLGGTVYNFIANHAHIVRMNPDVRDAVEDLPFVRWVGPLHPAYRLEEFMLDNAAWGETLFPLQKYNISVFEAGMGQKTIVADRIVEMGGIVDRVHAGKFLLEATLTPRQLFEVIRWDEVMFVDRWSPGETDMDIAREISGANYVETVAGFTGEDVRGEVIDLGFNVNHVDFQSRPLILHTDVNNDSHGASTSGIVFGDGTGNIQGRGLLPMGQGIVADWDEVSVGQPRYDHTGELIQDPYYAVFQTASVGSTRTTEYTNISADTDAALFDFDIVHCQSQSNSGWEDSRPQAWAKNIISGGGVYHYDTETKSDDAWNHGASTGPATDGRIKPDLCHFYDNIFTVTGGSNTAYTDSFGGTSGATPNIAGCVGLFFQMWSEGIFNNPIDPNGTVFDNRSHMTTAKAMMINTAEQYPFTGLDHDLTRVHQGWGMPDLQYMYDMRYKMLIIDETQLLSNLGSFFYTMAVEPGEPQFKATLVYADPPGIPNSDQHRVNDLSLKVTSPSGIAYWGNNGLREGNWSTPEGSPNEVDTVENVFVENPESGMWTVEVFAHEVIQDGHVETPQLDVDYALVVSGVQETLPALVIQIPGGVPQMIPPEVETEIEVKILEGDETVVPGTELFYYRFDENDSFTEVLMEHMGGVDYLATLPGADCDDVPQFYFSAEGNLGTVVTNPMNAPDSYYEISEIGEIAVTFQEDFDSDPGWTTQGEWAFGQPTGQGGDSWGHPDPTSGYTGPNVYGYNLNGDYSDDVGGPYYLTTPAIDCSGLTRVELHFYRWLNSDYQPYVYETLEVSTDGSAWTEIWSNGNSEIAENSWSEQQYDISNIADGEPTVYIRWGHEVGQLGAWIYSGWNIDDVKITSFVCEEDPCPADVNSDDVVDIDDIFAILAHWGEGSGVYDVNNDGVVDIDDIFAVLADWGPCP